MKFLKTIGITLSVWLLSSCSTPKQITYFQDLRPGETESTVTEPVEIRIQPKDKLSVLVHSQARQLTDLFNMSAPSQQAGQEKLSGYTVTSRGTIDFPVLGEIKVQGMTREEVAACIKQELKSHDLIKDPVVTVEFMNLTVSVLGEVNRPGRYDIDKDRMTILDALSRAGDLTIYGKREKVLVLRNEEGRQRVYGINLCSGAHIYSSPVYYLQQNDVVYVEPNATKMRQATVNGNNVRSVSFWTSLASLLVSISVLIFK